MKEMISFLGPKGTFSHEAASILGDDLVPYCTIPAVMESIVSNQCVKGIVPIENSIEGPVGITLDSLAHEFDLNIVGEIIISINQNLIVNPGSEIEDIKDIYSHQQAISQCQSFIRENNFQPHYSVSTASAAKSIIGDKTKYIVLAHLSEINNTPDIALSTIEKYISDKEIIVAVSAK